MPVKISVVSGEKQTSLDDDTGVLDQTDFHYCGYCWGMYLLS